MKKIFFLVCVLLPSILGYWQLLRLGYKNELIKQIEGRINNDPLILESIKEVKHDKEFIHVKFKCKYIKKKNIFLYDPKIYNGRTGFNLVSPCQLQDGRIVLVERGFILSKEDSFNINEEDSKGIILFPKKPNYFTPSNDVSQNLWFSLNIGEARKFLNLQIEDWYIKISEKSNLFPIREEIKINIPNNHLGYSITWFSIAISIFILGFRKFFTDSN